MRIITLEDLRTNGAEKLADLRENGAERLAELRESGAERLAELRSRQRSGRLCPCKAKKLTALREAAADVLDGTRTSEKKNRTVHIVERQDAQVALAFAAGLIAGVAIGGIIGLISKGLSIGSNNRSETYYTSEGQVIDAQDDPEGWAEDEEWLDKEMEDEWYDDIISPDKKSRKEPEKKSEKTAEKSAGEE